MRLYHFTNHKRGLQNIQRRRLKVARINELNDPYELLGVASCDPKIRDRYASMKAGLAEFMGLLCFSESWNSPVQWGHYAERHRGICLGFDVDVDVDKGLLPVKYVDERLKPNEQALRKEGEAATRHVIETIATKFSHWAYEQEHRLFVRLDEKDDRGLYFFDFGEQLALKEVTVGVCSTITRAELGAALGTLELSVEVFKAQLACKSFDVDRGAF